VKRGPEDRSMSNATKLVLGLAMSLALAFGFLHLFVPDFPYDFDRLHVFLFNLCAGATVLLTHASGSHHVPTRVWAYLALSVVYAVSAFLDLFWLTLAVSPALFAIVESVRIKRYSLFPIGFFRHANTSEKFLQASLLCLSLGIAIASLVILNNEYTHWVHYEKLTIDVFFLGYSFPLSLLTFSVMYSHMAPTGPQSYMIMKEVSFWAITLGVIVFFVTIIGEIAIGEIIVSNVLFAAVLMTYYIFLRHTNAAQQKHLLASGMIFLVVTAITGIFYLFEYLFPDLRPYRELVIMLHATVAIYGWNISGIFCIVRRDDFPIFKSSATLISLHWLTVMILVPLGKYYQAFSMLGLLFFMILIFTVFFNKSVRSTTST
jgi:hypothetical protein